MEDLLNDEDFKEEFGTEWEQELLYTTKKATSDLYSETTDEIDEKDSPQPKHLEVLYKSFGHKKFRPLQWKIINSIMNERRDNCAIMTTGYGKSLCYQYPSVYMGGLTIVVSPLISLMEDQVLAMKVANISACLLGSANAEQSDTIDDIFEDKYTLVYLTPEFSTGETGRDLLKNMYERLSITLIAIDEAHCTSTWGHDFRFQYRKLGIFKDLMPDVPILAVTATATPKVRDDIIEVLNLKNPQILCSGFNRPNLFFSVHLKGIDPFTDFRKVMDYEGGNWKFAGPTIIYCITRKSTENISTLLSEAGIESLPYHAGLPLTMRKEVHEKFLKDKVGVIVATIAFGMGIDKPDVRNIIHYGASNSIEGYYQEVGRAGRDGLPAKCIAFYANNDFVVHRRLREHSYGSKANKNNKEKMADLMLEYLSTRDCRRNLILSHFEGSKISTTNSVSCCDNCVRNSVQPDKEVFKDLDSQGKYDFTEDAKIFLEAVNVFGGKRGINMYVLFIRGSKSSKISSNRMKHRLHGSGKHKSEVWWKGIGALLEKEKYLEKSEVTPDSGFKYYTIHVTSKGKNFLENIGRKKLILSPTPDLINCLETKPTAWLGSQNVNLERSWLGSKKIYYHQPTTSALDKPTETNLNGRKDAIKLYKLLMNKRYQIATSLDCTPHQVATDKLLMDIAIVKPVTLEELKYSGIEGLSHAKLAKFGEEFLEIIRSNINVEESVVQKKQAIEELLIKYPLTTIGSAARATYAYFKSGLTVDEIANKRGVTSATILSNLADCIKIGLPIKLIDLGVTKEIKETIIKAAKTVDTGFSLLTPIKNACPPEITYSQVRIVINYVTVRQHLKNLCLQYEEFDDLRGIEHITASTDTPSVSESDSKLTQLLNAIDEVTKDEIKKETDENFSEEFDDADLAAACDVLETSLNEEDDGQPLPKKMKSEDAFSLSLLDSPPRGSHSTRPSCKDNQSVASTSKDGMGQATGSRAISSSSENTMGQSCNSKGKTDKLCYVILKRVV